jgi:hypothetical protein
MDGEHVVMIQAIKAMTGALFVQVDGRAPGI